MGQCTWAKVALAANDSHVVKAFQEAGGARWTVDHHCVLELHCARIRPACMDWSSKNWLLQSGYWPFDAL